MSLLVHSVRPRALHYNLCTSCPQAWIQTSSHFATQRGGLQNSDRLQRRYKGYIAPAGQQARPLEGFYAEILSTPLSQLQATQNTPAVQAPPEPIILKGNEEAYEKARRVFGSRDVEPEKRKKEIEAASHVVAGVMVPPKPIEPDNCCMSGCVNCVWDLYRDEMEEWAARSAEARTKMHTQRVDKSSSARPAAGATAEAQAAMSMDDDGGGSETNWPADKGQEALFDDIPVGIREFMRTEKKLKERHKAERAAAA